MPEILETPSDIDAWTKVPDDFCPECEHAPCVAGEIAYCTLPPRYAAISRLEDELFEYPVVVGEADNLHKAFVVAVVRLSGIAVGNGRAADSARKALERMLDTLGGD